MSQTSELVRAQFSQGDAARDQGLVTPSDVRRYDDLAYGPNPHWHLLDLYRPRALDGKKLPVIVSVHGGAWGYGDKARYQYYCMSLAQQGFAVVNFTYRLAPEFQFPASLEDSNLAFSWVLEHADEYGLDGGHVFAVGDSAGGHLLALYTAMCTNPEYAGQYPFAPPRGFVPRGIALNCGVYHIERQTGDLTTLLMEELLPQKGTAQELRQIDVPSHVNRNFPPVFIMTANNDFLREQALLLAQALMKQEVCFLFHFYSDQIHPLDHVFHCNIKLPEAARCNAEECNFFKRLL